MDVVGIFPFYHRNNIKYMGSIAEVEFKEEIG
jgi:hypothetical protein